MRLALAALLAALLLGTGPAAAKEKRVALVLGNGAYRHGGMLANPSRDARAMGNKLHALGFSVNLAINQGRAGMEAAFRDFSRKLDGADMALLFYAGHGLQVDGRNYLVPVDAKLTHETDVGFELLDVERFLELIAQRAKVGLVFLDACRNNPLAGKLRSRGAPSGAVGS